MLLSYVDSSETSFLQCIDSLYGIFPYKNHNLALSCPNCGESHLDRGDLALVTHYKYVYTCRHTWVTKKRAVSNPLVEFNLCLVEPKLQFSNDRGAYLCKMYKSA